MAVFTPVSKADLDQWLTHFSLGAATSIRGIASGIENSNFFIGTDAGDYVLTLFENLSLAQLPFYLQLMDHLARRGILVPAPVASRDGQLVGELHGKPAAIVSKLNGASEMNPQAEHCAQVGSMLARMHLAGQDFPLHQENLRGLAWWQTTAAAVLAFVDQQQATLLQQELTLQEQFAAGSLFSALPRGPIHGDLFRNNVMFDEGRLSGFFDFYFAGVDTLLFDLAVTCNDWCVDLASGASDPVRSRALLSSYQAVRPLSPAEQQAWPVLLRAAALRFWLSRLFDLHQPRAAQMLTPHDPAHFERILRQHISS